LIVTTTPSTEPLLHAGFISAGQHITAMGSDAEHKNEIAPDVFAKARYVCDRVQQVRVLGELHHAIEAGVIAADASFPELGDVIAKKAQGRVNDDEVTVCDLTGTGAQDTAIATLAIQRARAVQAGTIFHNDVTA
jgi:ornithine cyclodeaminase